MQPLLDIRGAFRFVVKFTHELFAVRYQFTRYVRESARAMIPHRKVWANSVMDSAAWVAVGGAAVEAISAIAAFQQANTAKEAVKATKASELRSVQREIQTLIASGESLAARASTSAESAMMWVRSMIGLGGGGGSLETSSNFQELRAKIEVSQCACIEHGAELTAMRPKVVADNPQIENLHDLRVVALRLVAEIERNLDLLKDTSVDSKHAAERSVARRDANAVAVQQKR